MHIKPALAEYAATEAPTFPDDAVLTFDLPNSFAFEIVTEICLSLWDPVGFVVSFFNLSFLTPSLAASRLDEIKLVPPSPKDTTFLLLRSGRRSKYFHIEGILPSKNPRVNFSFSVS